MFFRTLPCLLAATLFVACPEQAAEEYDIVIYGGTAGGVSAAVQSARLGKSVVLIEPGKHIGGMTSGGLGATDIGNKAAIGGISREFYQRVFRYYSNDDAWKQETRAQYQSRRQAPSEDTMWTFEPRVAEQILREMLTEAKVTVKLESRLRRPDGVKRDGKKITRITMESGDEYAGKMFIDCTYEGDLMAAAGCAYHVGRESNSLYKETLNGVQLGSKSHQFKVEVDPYRKPGDPTSKLLPNIHDGSPGKHGDGDNRVQAYNFRLCLTDVPENRLPHKKPEGYNPLDYELALRTIVAGQWDNLGSASGMPNRKTDTNNNGAFSTDYIGKNYDYPDGGYQLREKIWDEHRRYIQGWLFFLANDPRVPEKIREQANRWGLSKDEFVDTDHWPHQLYVREARRLISDYVMTQHNCQGREVAPQPVGLAAYNMDSHNVQRYVLNGKASNEGDVQVGVSPYGIAYRSIVPKAVECSNLFVPVCLSSTHIAYGSIRMEPVFMVLGQSSATAAALAIDDRVSVQQVDYDKLRTRLLADKQVLEWTGPRRGEGRQVASLKGIVVDDGKAELVGEWPPSSVVGNFVGEAYLHDKGEDRGKKQARFTVKLPQAGRYEVRIAYTPQANRATNVPVTVESAEGSKTILVNQQRPPRIDGLFHSLGVFSFNDDQPAVVIVSNRNVDGHVIVDAVQWLSVESK